MSVIIVQEKPCDQKKQLNVELEVAKAMSAVSQQADRKEIYTNSSMVVCVKLSPHNSGLRTSSIDRITPHCVVGQCTAEGLGEWFSRKSTKASSNYGIDREGRIGMYVEEKNRSWCSSSNANDQRAVTIECASDKTEPYAFKPIVYDTLIKLCVDICQRNGKTKLLWLGDKEKALAYEPKSDEMILTVHRWFAATLCPGDWMYSRMGDLAERVTAALSSRSQNNLKPDTKNEDSKSKKAEDKKIEIKESRGKEREVKEVINKESKDKKTANGSTNV